MDRRASSAGAPGEGKRKAPTWSISHGNLPARPLLPDYQDRAFLALPSPLSFPRKLLFLMTFLTANVSQNYIKKLRIQISPLSSPPPQEPFSSFPHFCPSEWGDSFFPFHLRTLRSFFSLHGEGLPQQQPYWPSSSVLGSSWAPPVSCIHYCYTFLPSSPFCGLLECRGRVHPWTTSSAKHSSRHALLSRWEALQLTGIVAQNIVLGSIFHSIVYQSLSIFQQRKS